MVVVVEVVEYDVSASLSAVRIHTPTDRPLNSGPVWVWHNMA